MTLQEEAWNKFCQEVMPDQNVTYALRGTFGTVFKRAWDEATAIEREACLADVNQGTGEAVSSDALKILRMERDRISAAIRARGTG